MKNENENISSPDKCSYCGSSNLEKDEKMFRCIDCGMGKYAKGSHKGSR
jgi:hypothetical protein